jgi:predicted MFS family arabinose efflux permease
MLSQSQAYITDHHVDGSLSVALSRFQGVAIGMAFMIGIPLGAVIAARYSLRTPLRVAVTLCAVNCVLIATLLPRPPKRGVAESTESTGGIGLVTENNRNGTIESPTETKRKGINWAAANPLGAALMLTRTRKLLSGSMAYFLLNVAHCGVQVVWINYLQRRFGMSQVLSGSTLMVVGVVVATLPQLVM